jgi:hypothetical protein
MTQERIALGIVGLAAIYLVWSGFQNYVAEPLAQWLLKRGHVKMAMQVREQSTRVRALRAKQRKDCCE